MKPPTPPIAGLPPHKTGRPASRHAERLANSRTIRGAASVARRNDPAAGRIAGKLDRRVVRPLSPSLSPKRMRRTAKKLVPRGPEWGGGHDIPSIGAAALAPGAFDLAAFVVASRVGSEKRHRARPPRFRFRLDLRRVGAPRRGRLVAFAYPFAEASGFAEATPDRSGDKEAPAGRGPRFPLASLTVSECRILL